MPEMPHAGEHHGDAVLVGGRDHLVVAHRAAGLDHRGGAGFDRDQSPSAKGKKASEATTEPLVIGSGKLPALAASRAFRAAMRAESTRLIWPAPMPTVAQALGIDDGVGLHVLGDAEGEEHVGELGRRSARAW